jgi:hypothetical protein
MGKIAIPWLEHQYHFAPTNSREGPFIMGLIAHTPCLKSQMLYVISHLRSSRYFLIAMKSTRKKKAVSPSLQNRLSELEETAAQMGIQVHYDLLEAAGLKLRGGICKIKGEYHLYIDRRKSFADKIDILQDWLEHPLPQDIPEGEVLTDQAIRKN